MVKDNEKGFTLIELLIVMAIIILFTSISLIGFRGGEERFALQRSAHILAQDLRIAKEMAMSAREVPEHPAFEGGHGIHLDIADPSSYILFADLDNDRIFDVVGGIGEGIIDTIELERGVRIVSLSPHPTSTTIVFIPPDPAVSINNFAATSTVITLGVDGLVETKTIRVNNAGLIAIE